MLSNTKGNDAYLQALGEAENYVHLALHPEIQKVAAVTAAAGDAGDVQAGIKALQRVIALYPQAENIQKAKDRLASLQERKSAEMERERARLEREKAENEHRLAKQKLQLKAIRESSNLTGAIRALQAFLINYPASPYRAEAELMLKERQQKEALVNSTGL